MLFGAAIAIAGGGACGKAIYPIDRFDPPLKEISGPVFPARVLNDAQLLKARVGLLWTDPTQNRPDVPSSARAVDSRIIRATDDVQYRLTVHRPPPPEALFEVRSPDGETATLAIAEIVLYADMDDDRTFAVRGPRAAIVEPDQFLATSTSILRYVMRPFAVVHSDFPLGSIGPTTAAGFDLVQLNCDGQLPSLAAPKTVYPQTGVTLVVQPSQTNLPEVRTCMRSQSR